MSSPTYDRGFSPESYHETPAVNFNHHVHEGYSGKMLAGFIPILLPPFIPIGQTDFLLLAGSGLAAILIIALIIAIAILILFLRRSRTQEQATPQENSSASPTVTVQEETTPSVAVEEQEPAVDQPAEPDDPLATIPVGTVTADDIATSPRMPGLPTVAEPETLPISGKRPPTIGWQIAGLTDVGRRRDHNEDSLLMTEATFSDGTPYGLYVVADGLGGHQGGEVASRLSIEAIQEEFIQQPPPAQSDSSNEWLRKIALVANQAILSHQEDQKEAKKMGSTLVMALVTADQAYIANVGDSRAYHLTEEDIVQISVDHSLVERLVQIGQLTREEARTHKNRNVIYNTLGDKADPEVGLYQISLEPGDRILLCSDGLTDMLTDDSIFEISRNHPDPVETCQLLVQTANAAGGNDNITAIIVQLDE